MLVGCWLIELLLIDWLISMKVSCPCVCLLRVFFSLGGRKDPRREMNPALSHSMERLDNLPKEFSGRNKNDGVMCSSQIRKKIEPSNCALYSRYKGEAPPLSVMETIKLSILVHYICSILRLQGLKHYVLWFGNCIKVSLRLIFSIKS